MIDSFVLLRLKF